MGALRAEKAKDQAIEWVLERVTYVDEAGAEIDRSILEAAEVDSDAASEDEDEPTATDTNEESE
jgi:hypothetical protein